MSQPPNQPRTSFSLFPSANTSNPSPPNPRTHTPMGRRSESRERRTPTPQQYNPQPAQGLGLRAASPQASPPRNGRATPQTHVYAMPAQEPEQHRVHQRHPSWQQHQQQQHQQQQHQQQQQQPQVIIQEPSPVADMRSHAEASIAQQYQPTQRQQARDSIAKPPLSEGPASTTSQPLRSMFPTYNPDIALEHQQYAPTQASPTHIPAAVISRSTPYQPSEHEEERATMRSPARGVDEPSRRWPRLPQQPPVIPQVSQTEALKSLWRVANGWRASSSEGRVYCLKMTQDKDAPVYMLGTENRAFWYLRLDPTSTSAKVTLKRCDPTKSQKSPTSPVSSPGGFFRSKSSGSIETKDWQEAINTTLEEESRRHQPNDGLVAMLMPSSASKMAQERAEAPAAVQMAENECGRLVWDDDTSTYFLVHSALQKPFFISIERSPAWSRTEYTLEHTESPQHLAKLTRDGSGSSGWLELDTGLASKIDSFFILDVAVSALLLVANFDEKNNQVAGMGVEAFEAPPGPVVEEPEVVAGGRGGKQGKRRMEEFDIDVESQEGDSLGKMGVTTKTKEKKAKSAEEKLPFLVRVIVKLTKGVFKTFIFFLTGIAKCFGLVFKALYKCCGSKY